MGEQVRRRLLVLVVLLVVAASTAFAVGRTTSSAPRSSLDAAGGLHRSGARLPDSAAQVPAPSPDPGAGDHQVPAHPAEAIAALLAARAAAVLHSDPAAWQAGLDPKAPAAFRTAQARLFTRLAAIRPHSWSYQVAGGSALPARRLAALGATAWLADVQLDYQLGSGGPAVRREQFLSIVARPEGWRIAADTDGPTVRDIWDLGPIVQARGGRCLVLGASTRRAVVDRLAAQCSAAATRVDAAWGTGWPRSTTLIVPADLLALAGLLGRGKDVAGLDRTAAVTVGPADGPADDVLVNGAGFEQLSALGRRVVLTHELVHVATRAGGSRSAPTWLEEGYADHVAYAGTGLPARQIAGDALSAVRAGRLPRQLPGSGDFNAAGAGASAAYGEAWVAVGLIADRAGGPAGMKAFYQRAAGTAGAGAGPALQAALAAVGLRGTDEFVPLWQARLRALAR